MGGCVILDEAIKIYAGGGIQGLKHWRGRNEESNLGFAFETPANEIWLFWWKREGVSIQYWPSIAVTWHSGPRDPNGPLDAKVACPRSFAAQIHKTQPHMKAFHSSIHSHSINLFRAAILTTVLVAAGWAIPKTACAQTIYAASSGNSIGEYSASGTVIDSGFITGVPNSITSLAVSGNDVYVGTADNIGIYNASNGSLITNISISYQPWFLAVSGNNLLAGYWGNSGVCDYNANTGALISSTFVQVSDPLGLAVVGNDLYVAGNGGVGEYNATTGAAINSSLITGLNNPMGIAVSGTDLFVATGGAGQANYAIGEYNATTGETINASLTTLWSPWALSISGNTLYASTNAGASINEIDATSGASTGSFSAVGPALATQSVPEPATWVTLLAGLGSLLAFRRRR